MFGKEFSKNNNDKCEVIINGKNGFKLNNLGEGYHCGGSKNREEKIYEIIIKEIKENTDMSLMFQHSYCKIIQIDFSIWDVSNVNNMSYMSYMFGDYDIMSNMLYYCKNIPDISKWNVSNVSYELYV